MMISIRIGESQMPSLRPAGRSQAGNIDSTTKAYRAEWARIKEHLVASKNQTKGMSEDDENFPSEPELGWKIPKGQSGDLEIVSYNFWKIRKRYDSIMRRFSFDMRAASTALKFQNHELAGKNKIKSKNKSLTYLLDTRLRAIFFISQQLQDTNIYFRLCIELFDSTQIYNNIQKISAEFQPQRGLAWALQEATKKISEKYNLHKYFEIFENEGYLGNPIDISFLSNNLDLYGWTGQLGYRPVFNNTIHDNLSMQFLPRVTLFNSEELFYDYEPLEEWELQLAIREQPLNRDDYESLCDFGGVISNSFSGSISEAHLHTGNLPSENDRKEGFCYFPVTLHPFLEVNWVIVPGPSGEPIAAFEKRIQICIRSEAMNENIIILPIQRHLVEIIHKSKLSEISKNRKLGIIFGRKDSKKTYANTLFSPENTDRTDGMVSIIDLIFKESPIKPGISEYQYISESMLQNYLHTSSDRAIWLENLEQSFIRSSYCVEKYAEMNPKLFNSKQTEYSDTNPIENLNIDNEFPYESVLLDLEQSCSLSTSQNTIIEMSRCSHIKTSVLMDYRSGLFQSREERYREIISRI